VITWALVRQGKAQIWQLLMTRVTESNAPSGSPCSVSSAARPIADYAAFPDHSVLSYRQAAAQSTGAVGIDAAAVASDVPALG